MIYGIILSMNSAMKKKYRGFSLLEVLVATAVFLLFAIGIYGGLNLVYKIVYSSRLRILQTAILDEKLETVRNLPFDQVGITNGIPVGVLPYSQTVRRNGIDFDLITTVRNIDDPFDGMATGTVLIDTSPADYKLVEMSIICHDCIQQKPVVLITRVSPRELEGASEDGSLFVHVFDANGHDLQGATVNIAYIGSTTINITDTTDNEGMVRVIGTPTGTEKYHITVSKSGFSTDYTVSSSLAVPNPVKSPSTVISQTVTEINFSIDYLSSLSLQTINQSCYALGNSNFNIRGEKLIGNNPIVYKYDQDLYTNASGFYDFLNIEWDKYHFSASGTIYDIAGSIPMLPIDLTPGLTQDAFLILKTHSSDSLLVQVRDAGTLQPLSNATVRLSAVGYDQSASTSVGYLRQTDWSGGSGQEVFNDNTRYYADNGNIVNNSPDGDVKLKKVGGDYLTLGWLESSIFDFGAGATYRNIVIQPLSQPTDTYVKFQIATDASSTPAVWNYFGPDGTANTYYTATSSLINSSHYNQQYLRYKAYLITDDTKNTPTLSEVLFTYTNQCTPPGQVFFDNLSDGLYTLEVSRDGYNTITSVDFEVLGSTITTVNMSVSGT